MKKQILALASSAIFLFSCGDIEESMNKIFNTAEDNTRRKHKRIDVIPAMKYEVISKKTYFFKAEELRKMKGVYLIEGDIALCGKTSAFEENNYDEFCFCWFKHHTGRITTGYLMTSNLIFEDQTNSSKWHSLTNLYSANYKAYFFRPKEITKSRSYLIKGDIAICDNDVIEIQGREYCYCEFKKPDGSNIGRVTTGYLEKEKLRKW